jgi:hypothetical protein
MSELIAYKDPNHPSNKIRPKVQCSMCGTMGCVGRHWGNWCFDCNVKRIDGISKTLESMVSLESYRRRTAAVDAAKGESMSTGEWEDMAKPTLADSIEGEKRFYAIRQGAYPRRVDMMAQIVCLERQLDLLDRALTSKNETVIELQNAIDDTKPSLPPEIEQLVGRLRELATKATPGQQQARSVPSEMPVTCVKYGVISLQSGLETCRVWERNDAEYFAAASPENILKLLDHLAPKADQGGK